MNNEKIDKVARRNANIALVLSAISLFLIISMFGIVTENEFKIDGLFMNQDNYEDNIYSNTQDINNIENAIFKTEISNNTTLAENLIEYKKVDEKRTYKTTTISQPRSD